MSQNNRTENTNILKNENDNSNNKLNIDQKDLIKFSFSNNYANILGEEVINKDNNIVKDNNNVTILEQKISKEIKREGSLKRIPSFIQSKEINKLKDSLNIFFSFSDSNKESEYLSPRKFPSYDINEFEIIKQKVSQNLIPIKDHLLKIQCNYKEYNKNKAVGPLMPLTALIEHAYLYKPENKNLMNKKYQRLKNNICNFRTIYGDGNCYYRAVMFRYIELLILNKKSEYLKLIIIDIYRSFQTEEVTKRLIFGKQKINPNLIVQIMIILLELVEKDEIITAHQIFYKSLLFSKHFDFSLILYFRYILYDYIKKNEKKLYLQDFPVLIGNLLPSQYENDGVFNFNLFYEKYLLRMFVYAEKIIIYLTPFVLGINVDVILFDDDEDEIVKHFKFVGKDELNIKENIFLIHKKGHYENIFSIEDNNKFKDVYSCYRNDLANHFIDINNKVLNDNNQMNNMNMNNINIQKQNIENKNLFNPKTEIKKNNNYMLKKTLNNFNNNSPNNTHIITNPYINNNINNPYSNNNINNPYLNNNININKNEMNQKRSGTTKNYIDKNNMNMINNPGSNINSFKNYNIPNQIIQDNNLNQNNNYNINQQTICYQCSCYYNTKNITINNMCKQCLSNIIFNQLKILYIDYLNATKAKINNITKNDFNNNFLNKIYLTINTRSFTIYQIIEEYLFNSNKDKNAFLNELIHFLKSKICLLCYADINNNSQFKIKCGCNFCSREHLNHFFKDIVKNRIRYNYKCICSYEYNLNEVLELCIFLYNNKLYSSEQRYLEHIGNIFSIICCKCGNLKNNMKTIIVNESLNYNFIHYICNDCINQGNTGTLHCLICNKNHKY